jgi:hypothetical protein
LAVVVYEHERAYLDGRGAPGHDATAQIQKIMAVDEAVVVTGAEVFGDQFLKEILRNRGREGWTENDI